MRNRKLLLTSLLSIALLLTSCNKNVSFDDAPDYSKSNKHMNMYAYAAPGDGIYTLDGKKYQATDDNGNPITFQTKEMFTEYKDCGFDIIMFQSDDAYRGEEYETSHIKALMDLAYSCDLKSIIFDKRIHDLSTSTTSLLGYTVRDVSKQQFIDQADLNSYISDCMKDYKNHEGFHGVMLRDEPTYQMFNAIGEVYKAVKSVGDYFVQCNLFPFGTSDYSYYKKGATEETVVEAYDYYVNEFVNQTNSNYIMFDSYPMTVSRDDPTVNTLKIDHLKGMQIVAEACEKRNLEYYMVIQSSSWLNNNSRRTRPCLNEDLLWQWNVCLGLGVDQISYFTYQRKRTNLTTGEYFDDGTSFITSQGDKTPLYYWAKEGHVGVHALAKIMMNFKYKGLQTYANGDYSKCSIKFLSGVKDIDSFVKIEASKVTFTKEGILLISEMYDEAKNQYGYMVMNLADPSYKVDMETEITFKEGNKAVNVNYDNGTIKNFALNNNKFPIKLAPGEGAFVMPF